LLGHQVSRSTTPSTEQGMTFVQGRNGKKRLLRIRM
jgi:hypothetical protein